MLILETTKISPINSTHCKKFEGIAYDGYYFYLTASKDCQIYKYDSYFKQKECIDVSRDYTSICYDKYFKCFWAITASDSNKVFKLDLSLKEVDCISIRFPNICISKLTGICCYSNKKQLLISCDYYVALIDKLNNTVATIINKNCDNSKITAIQCIGDCCISSQYKDYYNDICAYTSEDTLNCLYSLPSGFQTTDMAADFSSQHSINFQSCVYILATKNNSLSYIVRLTLNYYKSKESISCDCNTPMPCECNDCASPELCTSFEETYGSIEQPLLISHTEDKFDNTQIFSASSDFDYAPITNATDTFDWNHNIEDVIEARPNCKCDCNSDFSSCSCELDDFDHYCGNDMCQSCHHHNCHQCDKHHNCIKDLCEVIESIALIEASLAHILNAEGEKIQKVVATSNNIHEILAVNKSINKTIVNITHLEQVLYSKLQLAIELYEDHMKENKPHESLNERL